MRALNDQAWYTLPDGTAVIACASGLGGYVLYTESEWESETTADYEVQPDGRITFQGNATGWTVNDLVKV